MEVLPAPAAPAGLQLTSGRNRLTASWAPVLHATSYIVQWKGPTEQYSHGRRGVVTGTTYVLQSLAADTQYTVRVQARRAAAADGPYSSEVSARTEEAPVGVCSRTEAVRDAILARIAGVTDCAQVYRTDLNRITGILRIRNASGLSAGDFAGLGGVTLLRLDGNPNLTNLPTGVFAGLSGLATLRLDGAGLTTLPTGAFDGLSGLRELRAHGNGGSPFTLDVEAERVGGYEVRARIDEAAPGPVQVTWTASGGSTATGTATIPAGARTSPPFGEAAARAVTVTLSDPVRAGVSEGTDDEAGAQTGFRLAVPAAGAAATIPGSPCETERVVGRGAARPLIADCKLLLKIKDELRGTASLDWGGSTAIGSWRGVTVSGGRVTGLSITGAAGRLVSDTRLKGRIPARLAGLDGLTTLYLVGHRFSGGVPAELGRLTGLTGLTLRNNGLAGAVPAELAGLTRLTGLDLSENDLTGAVPSALSGLTSLQVLDLSGNDLTGAVPSALTSLTGLAVLDLSENSLSGGIPASLAGLTRLATLSLNGNSLTGAIPEALGGLNLGALHLRGNQLTGCIPRALRSHASTVNPQRLFGGLQGALPVCIAAPRSLTATAGDRSVTLRWNAPEGHNLRYAVRYTYRQSTDAGTSWTDWAEATTSAAATNVTWTATGLTNNLTYTFEVRAEFANTSRPSNRATATPTVPAPLSLSATAGDRSIALAWTDPGDATLTGYEVSTDAGANWTVVAGSGAATAAHTLTGLVNGRAYAVRLRAVRGGVRGAAASANATPRLPAPSNLAATPDDAARSIALSWTAPAGTIVAWEYRMKRGAASWSPDWTRIAGSGPATVSHTLTAGLAAGGVYTVELRAVQGAQGAVKGLPSSVPAALTPGAPAGLTVQGADAELALSWTRTTDDSVTGYEASADGGATWVRIAAATAATTSHTLTGLVNGRAYTVGVRAWSRTGSGAAATATGTPTQCRNGTAVPNPATNTGLVGDCTALLALKDALRGTRRISGGPDDWSGGLDISRWSGVGLLRNRVWSINLAGSRFGVQKLDGVVPAGLARLSGLQVLNLGANRLTGSIPAELGNLRSLATLNLRGNLLTGSIPTELTQLPARTGINLSGNRLTGCIPALPAGSTVNPQTDSRGHSYNLPQCSTLPDLRSLEISAGTLHPPFSAATIDYTASVGNSVSSLTVTPTAAAAGATLRFAAGASATTVADGAGHAVGLSVGVNSIRLQVSAASGVRIRVYIIRVTRAAAATAAPGAPAGLSAVAGNAQATLTWLTPRIASGPDASITRYEVSTDGGSTWTGIPGSGAATVSHTVTGLANGERYDFRLRAVNEIGVGAAASVGVARPLDGSGAIPSAPGSVSAVAGYERATLTWSRVHRNAIGYEVSTDDGSTWARVPGDGATTSHVVTGLTNGVLYNFRIRTLGPGGTSRGARTQARPLSACGTGGAVRNPLANASLVDDCELLLLAKDELRGTASLNWGGSTAIGSWRGVTVSGGRVTGLSITGAAGVLVTDTRLKGRIPARLAGLDALTTLFLVGHQFSGGIPAELGRLTGLTNLTLRNNGLAGSVPAELAGLTRLTGLDLSGNDLTGAVPSGLSSLTRLTGLYLSENDLTGAIPSELSSLTSLSVLDLSGNDLTGGIPSGLTGLTSLRTLNLSDNDLTGAVPGGLIGFAASGRSLDLRRNQLTGCIPYVLRGRASTINPQRVLAGGSSRTAPLFICIAAPRSLAATAGDRSVALRWNAPEDHVSGRSIRYTYRRSTDAGTSWTDWAEATISAAATNVTWTATGLANGLTYTFEVRAERITTSEPSNRAAATPTVPAPLSLSATAGDRSIALAWTDPGDVTLTGYEVSTDAGTSWAAVAGSGAATAAHTLTGLVNGRAYAVRVRAVRGGVRGAAASANATPRLPAPSGLAAAPDNAARAVALTWNAVTGGVLAYEYRMKRGAASWSPDWTRVPGSSGATIAHTIRAGLTLGGVYTVELRAVQGAQGAVKGRAASATASLTPGAPAGLTAQGADAELALSWTRTTDDSVTGYETSTDGGATWTPIAGANATTTSHTLTGLVNGRTYTAGLRAGSLAGTGAAATVTGTPTQCRNGTVVPSPATNTGLVGTAPRCSRSRTRCAGRGGSPSGPKTGPGAGRSRAGTASVCSGTGCGP